MTAIQLSYCQFLLSSPFNFTQTYLSDHKAGLSHDQINRAMQRMDVRSEDLWEAVQETIQFSPNGYIAFDDSVLDKHHSFKIELVRSQWSGNEHRTIKGIGVVTCVYVNPELGKFWAIDYKLYAPDTDGKSKIDHVKDMLESAVEEKKISFATVLMDSWYSSRELMLYIAELGKVYYTTVKANRLVAEHRGVHAYQRVDTLDWNEEEQQKGKLVRLNDFPNEHRVKLFQVIVLPGKTELVVTNDLSQDDRDKVRQVCKIRWKIEEFHREVKQLTGIEACQCRKATIQRNHIGCAMLVWARLKNLAYQTGKNVYELWKSQYDSFVTTLLAKPSIPFA